VIDRDGRRLAALRPGALVDEAGHALATIGAAEGGAVRVDLAEGLEAGARTLLLAAAALARRIAGDSLR
jgi:hypothetical protein